MAKWITNWTATGERGKWARCSAAFAVSVLVEGRFVARLVEDRHTVSRIILITPSWARTMADKHRAVALALKLSPLDRFRQNQIEDRSHAETQRRREEPTQKPIQKTKPLRIPPSVSSPRLCVSA